MDWGAVAWLLLILFCAQVIIFVVLYVARSAWRTSPTGRAIAAFFGVIAATLAGFVGLALVAISDLVFVAVFAAGNVVMSRLVQLLVRAQRSDTPPPNG